jgi:uncharacterized protein YutE (UPF0331/DUF86 family)
MLQEKSIRLENSAKRYAVKKSCKMSPERASDLKNMILSRHRWQKIYGEA